ncbi:MAG: SDR family NAD(P)-dependent oxidoreductase [Ruminococcaceae bacterium]|nr:SDR family NAD(P)-dependent oxidoreductase [Oscillospiraceae bacterium]
MSNQKKSSIQDKKVVWVTGASSGIGEALAKEYNARGAFIVLSARREEELNRVKGELKYPENAMILPLDVTHFDTVDDKVSQVVRHCGKIDMLINSAGIDYKDWVRNTPLSIYEKVMEINFYGNIAITLKVLPLMEERGRGHIACITSVNGVLSDKCSSAYAAAKHGLHGFYDSLRAEVPKKITVSLITPGYINTNITVNSLNGKGNFYGEHSEACLKGMAPEKMAKYVVKRLEKKSPLIYVGGFTERFGILVHDLFPTLFYKIARQLEPEYINWD